MFGIKNTLVCNLSREEELKEIEERNFNYDCTSRTIMFVFHTNIQQ